MEYGIIAVILVLDQITKAVIQNSAAVKAGVEVIPDFFYLTYVQNTGAAWSMLSGHQVFLCLIAAAAICVMWVFMQKAKKEERTPEALKNCPGDDDCRSSWQPDRPSDAELCQRLSAFLSVRL